MIQAELQLEEAVLRSQKTLPEAPTNSNSHTNFYPPQLALMFQAALHRLNRVSSCLKLQHRSCTLCILLPKSRCHPLMRKSCALCCEAHDQGASLSIWR